MFSQILVEAEDPEEETALTEPFPQSEIAAAHEAIPAEPQPESAPAEPEAVNEAEPEPAVARAPVSASAAEEFVASISDEAVEAPVERGGLRFEVSHPSRKNKDAARVGHPAEFIASIPDEADEAPMEEAVFHPSDKDPSLGTPDLKEHGFSRAAEDSGSDAALQAAEKLNSEGGGGFNPRIKPAESPQALATEGRFPPISPLIPSFSAACLAAESVAAAHPASASEPASDVAVGPLIPLSESPAVKAEKTPEPEPAAVEAELPSAPSPEPSSAAEPVREPAPALEAGPTLPLIPQPKAEEEANKIADEKAAAKLAARQRKLDESSEQSSFSVLVGQVYDGPLDLLLDLIRKQDIDIYDIPIARITAQFLAYVNQLKASDVDVAGEFIYTASLLIHIKSRMLLPRADSSPDEAGEDPRRELVDRLLEHERFKNAAQMLQQKQMLEAATWSNPGLREFQDDEAAEPEIAADTVDLVRIFREILERARKRPAFNVEEDSVTVGQMIQFLARRLTMEDKPVALRRLLSHTRSERALIAMFLALLELVRLQAILLRQDRQFSEIFIKKNTGFDAVMNEGLANARDDWR